MKARQTRRTISMSVRHQLLLERVANRMGLSKTATVGEMIECTAREHGILVFDHEVAERATKIRRKAQERKGVDVDRARDLMDAAFGGNA